MATEDDNEDPVQASRRIRRQFNVYLSQTSQYNPFGPNSMHSTYQDKVVYKYNLIKEYIRLSRKDEFLKQYEQSRFLGTMILGFVGGYFAALGISTLLRRGRPINPSNSFGEILLYATSMTAGFGYSYFQAHDRYNRNVCKYLLDKYKTHAVGNGFRDYEISR